MSTTPPAIRARTKIVRRSATPAPRPTFDKASFVAKARQFLQLRNEAATLDKQLSALKTGLKATVEEYGLTDDKGHKSIALPEAVFGYTTLVAERRESISLDEAAAKRILAAKKLTKECTHTYLRITNPEKILAYLRKNAPELVAEVTDTITEYDEDKITAAHYEGKLSEDDFDAILKRKVTYAFVPRRERGLG